MNTGNVVARAFWVVFSPPPLVADFFDKILVRHLGWMLENKAESNVGSIRLPKKKPIELGSIPRDGSMYSPFFSGQPRVVSQRRGADNRALQQFCDFLRQRIGHALVCGIGSRRKAFGTSSAYPWAYYYSFVGAEEGVPGYFFQKIHLRCFVDEALGEGLASRDNTKLFRAFEKSAFCDYRRSGLCLIR